MQENVLITGASGLVGQHLSRLLIQKGYRVLTLGRTARGSDNFEWNPAEGRIDQEALQQADHIVHLAGANIGEKRWTAARRTEILQSRVDSCKLLFETASGLSKKPQTFVSASAVGLYGYGNHQQLFNEFSPAGKGFLADVCKEWEAAAQQFENAGIRTVVLRTGVVLAREGGVLASLEKSTQQAPAVVLGSGLQPFPWIHIQDLCNLYLETLQNQRFSGAYNAVASEYTDNRTLTHSLASVLNKRVFPVHVPAFLLRTMLGSRSELLLKGQQVCSMRLPVTGFSFRFPSLAGALADLYPEKH